MAYTINNAYKAKYYGGKRPDIKYIVVHYTANSGTTATAKSNANYFANGTTRKASAHYVVDEGTTIYQCVPDDHVAYSVGDDQKYTNGGASMKWKITNTNSISIEMVSHSDAFFNYYIPDATLSRTAELIKALQKKHNIPNTNVFRHYDVTGKLCPQPLVDKAKWDAFLNRLKEEVEDLTKEEVIAVVKEMLSGTGTTVSDWAKESWEKAKAEGITDGSNPKGYITREQVIAIIERLKEK